MEAPPTTPSVPWVPLPPKDPENPDLILLPTPKNAQKEALKVVEVIERNGYKITVYSYKVTAYGYTIDP